MPPAACWWAHRWTMMDATRLLSLSSDGELCRSTGRYDGDRDDDGALSATAERGRTVTVTISRIPDEEARISARKQRWKSMNRRMSG